MSFFSYHFSSFGIDISDFSLKAAEIRRKKRELLLTAWNEVPLSEGIIEKGEIKDASSLASAIRTLVGEKKKLFSTRYVVCSLPESKSFIKLIHIEKKLLEGKTKKEEQREVIVQQLPKHIPLPPEDVHIDWIVAPDSEQKEVHEVLIGAVPKDIIASYTHAIQQSGLVPVALEIEAQSIVRALCREELRHDSEGHAKQLSSFVRKIPFLSSHVSSAPHAPSSPQSATIFIDIGAARTGLILWADSMIQFTSSLPLSGKEMTNRIAEKMKTSFEEAEKTKKICGVDPKKCKGKTAKILEKPINALAKSIKEMSSFYTTHFHNPRPVDQIVLCGGGSQLAGLPTLLNALLEIPVVSGNPLAKITNPESANLPASKAPSLTTAIGLALRNHFT